MEFISKVQSATHQPITLKPKNQAGDKNTRRSGDVFNYCNIYSVRLIEINLIAISIKLPSKSVKST